MQIKYIACSWAQPAIWIVKIQRETKHFVIFNDRRIQKHGGHNGDNYFDTFDEAQQFLLDVEYGSLESIRSRMKENERRIEHFRGIAHDDVLAAAAKKEQAK